MNGPVSLLIALVTYGNAYLAQGKKAPVLDFNNSTLIYNNVLTFSDDKIATSLNIIARNPEEWFKFLKATGCIKLKIRYVHSNKANDFQDAGFVDGGGSWFIEADYKDHSNYWIKNDSVVNEKASDNRIWGTSFTVIKKAEVTRLHCLSIEDAKRNLEIALTQIAQFAGSQNLGYWKEQFDKAKENLTNSDPHVKYYKDFVISERLSLKAKQLLFAASLADVFGGMGSWNDHFFSKEIEPINIKLSAELFDKINDAVISAINNDN